MCLLYVLSAGKCTFICVLVKQLTYIGLHLLIPVGERKTAWNHIVELTGGGFSQCEGLLAQMGFHMGAELFGAVVWNPSRCLVRVPCCAQTYITPMLLLWLTWSGAQEAVIADYYTV